MADQQIATVPEVAKTLRLSTAHVYDLINAGVLPSIKFGRSVRVPLDSLKSRLETMQRGGVVPPTA